MKGDTPQKKSARLQEEDPRAHPQKYRKLQDSSHLSSSNSSRDRFNPAMQELLSSTPSPQGDSHALTQQDIQDMQHQMAQMEARGRQEQFLTSAKNLARDERQKIQFQQDHWAVGQP